MRWFCSIIAAFWSEILTFITKLSGLHLTLTPDLAILELNLDDIPPQLRHHILTCRQDDYSETMENSLTYRSNQVGEFFMSQ